MRYRAMGVLFILSGLCFVAGIAAVELLVRSLDTDAARVGWSLYLNRTHRRHRPQALDHPSWPPGTDLTANHLRRI